MSKENLLKAIKYQALSYHYQMKHFEEMFKNAKENKDEAMCKHYAEMIGTYAGLKKSQEIKSQI